VSFENTYTGWILEDYLQLQTAAPSAATKTLQQLIDECKACQNQEKKWCIDYATTYEYCDNKCEGQFTVELTNCETTTGRATQTAAQTTCEKTAGQVCVIDYTKCEGTLVRDACEIGGVCCKGKAKEGGAVSKPATCADTMRTLMILRFAANMFLKEPETDRVCYSVCGTQYDTAAGRAPVCAKGIGSAEVPIAYKNSTYECKEQSCGSWSNKKVKIEIAGPEGNTVKTDYTVTDGNGRFSYTFDAPAADGEFTAIVSIPKDS
jgi:hypothetical protein